MSTIRVMILSDTPVSTNGSEYLNKSKYNTPDNNENKVSFNLGFALRFG
jgi:hypothetical protein